MRYDPQLHHRRSVRLRGYDYTSVGAYFVTICVRNRRCLFGIIVDGEMRANGFGEIVTACWDDLPKHYAHVALDAFVLMPNHVHGIIFLTNRINGHAPVGAGFKPAPTAATHPLSEIVRAFKTFSARRINACRGTPQTPVWQRNYFEHIIRHEESLQKIRTYTAHNPARWTQDKLYSER